MDRVDIVRKNIDQKNLKMTELPTPSVQNLTSQLEGQINQKSNGKTPVVADGCSRITTGLVVCLVICIVVIFIESITLASMFSSKDLKVEIEVSKCEKKLIKVETELIKVETELNNTKAKQVEQPPTSPPVTDSSSASGTGQPTAIEHSFFNDYKKCIAENTTDTLELKDLRKEVADKKEETKELEEKYSAAAAELVQCHTELQRMHTELQKTHTELQRMSTEAAKNTSQNETRTLDGGSSVLLNSPGVMCATLIGGFTIMFRFSLV